MYAVVGLIGAIVAIWQIYVYLDQKAANVSHTPMIVAIIAAIVALVCGGLFLSGRVNKSDEIHITE